MVEVKDFDLFKENTFSIIKDIADEMPIKDNDGDFVFKDSGMAFLCVFQATDPAFVRIILPNFIAVEDSQLEQAYALIARLNRENKVAKPFLNDRDKNAVRASVAVELLASSPDYFDKPLFKRCVKILNAAAQEFASNMSPPTDI
jgi:hypothetical protein